MADDKNKQGTADDIRIDQKDAAEIAYLQKQFPEKTTEEIKKAIAEVGPLRADIIAYLGKITSHSAW